MIGHSNPMVENADDDYKKFDDRKKRRKIQNRINQRNYRIRHLQKHQAQETPNQPSDDGSHPLSSQSEMISEAEPEDLEHVNPEPPSPSRRFLDEGDEFLKQPGNKAPPFFSSVNAEHLSSIPSFESTEVGGAMDPCMGDQFDWLGLEDLVEPFAAEESPVLGMSTTALQAPPPMAPLDAMMPMPNSMLLPFPYSAQECTVPLCQPVHSQTSSYKKVVRNYSVSTSSDGTQHFESSSTVVENSGPLYQLSPWHMGHQGQEYC